MLQVFTQRPKTILRNSLKLHVDTCSCKSFSFNRFRSYFCVPLSWNKPTIRNKIFDEKHLRKQYLSTKIMAEASKSGGEKRKLENGESETASPTAKKGKDEDFLSRIAESRTEVCQSVAEFKFNKKRVRVLSKAKDFPDESKGVVYWMSRDQRVQGIYVILYDNIKIHGHRPLGLGEIDGLHGTSTHRLSTCVLVNHLEGLSLPRMSDMSDHPFIFISLSCLLGWCFMQGLRCHFISMAD